ncbi:TRAP transporter small permease [Desulforhopalus sp. IMCC35007]|uniref:TRAP transporter small permease n=1 Tax=Desulforhopalus sp. IMCC35007 TaxID=2569543 RepID=UPI0010ADADB7|nr:TRAP transporter small permease [Desulforhopalus sp. IMCC35007]TKB11778.1 TRAP transporter small permease [Desulforhopalus sp. IMCC35007]
MNIEAASKKRNPPPMVEALPADGRMSWVVNRFEELVLSTILITMILLACTQIFLRTFFTSGLLWADPLLRYLVLWSGLLGAVAATGQGKHIALDIIGKNMPAVFAPWLALLCHIFSCLVAAGLTWAAVIFIRGEWEYSAAGPLSLPLWFWNSIFPLAFFCMAVKYLFLSLLQLRQNLSQSSKRRERER